MQNTNVFVKPQWYPETYNYTLWKATKELKQLQQTSSPIMKQDVYSTKTD